MASRTVPKLSLDKALALVRNLTFGPNLGLEWTTGSAPASNFDSAGNRKTSKGIEMKTDKKTLLLPILLIAVGTGWLLTTLGFAPGIDWIWTSGLGAVGVLTFVLCGVDKVSVVVGPFFILASFLSILRQNGRLRVDVEIPVLVIIAGVLFWIARNPAIPIPAWLVQDSKGTDPPKDE